MCSEAVPGRENEAQRKYSGWKGGTNRVLTTLGASSVDIREAAVSARTVRATRDEGGGQTSRFPRRPSSFLLALWTCFASCGLSERIPLPVATVVTGREERPTACKLLHSKYHQPPSSYAPPRN